MLSKHIKEKLNDKYSQTSGRTVRYPKDCNGLAEHISIVCKTKISASTLKRLYGFVKGASQEPRLYTLDLISEYLGYKGWEHLLQSLANTSLPKTKEVIKLKPEQVGKGQSIILSYEPSKKIEMIKKENVFLITSSNDRKLLVNDEIKFKLIELHYPLTLTSLIRKGQSIEVRQLATVSGITSIEKI